MIAASVVVFPEPVAPVTRIRPRCSSASFFTPIGRLSCSKLGTVFGINALSQSSDFKDNPTTKKADDGENNALVADMMFGIAITFGVTSAVLFLSNDAPSSAKATQPKTVTAAKKSNVKFTPAPYVNQHGGGFGGLFQF